MLIFARMATVAPGQQLAGMTFAVQQHLAKTTGFGTSFATDVFGTYGGVRWLTGVDTMAEVDKFQANLGSDSALINMISSAADLFVPGSGRNGLIQKIN